MLGEGVGLDPGPSPTHGRYDRGARMHHNCCHGKVARAACCLERLHVMHIEAATVRKRNNVYRCAPPRVSGSQQQQ